MTDLATQNQHVPQTRLDVAFFGITFAVGFLAYTAMRRMRIPQEQITGAIVCIMVLYAAASAGIPRLKVRLDQAGDNAYYLGLLFTLMSMAFALYEYGAAASGQTSAGTGADKIIENFGVALFSTITGIFLRVILSQMRIDPSEVESMTRIELSAAANRVRAALAAR